MNKKYHALLADKDLKDQECSTWKEAAQVAEARISTLVAEKEELEGRVAAAQEELGKRDEERTALVSQHEEAIRAKDEVHANALRSRNQAHAAEMTSLTSHNTRHIRQRDEARQELSALKLEVEDMELSAYNRGVVEARVAYTQHFDADFLRLADMIFGRYYRMALRYHEVPRDSDLWNTPPPSVLTGPPPPDSTQVETDTAGVHAAERDE